MTDVNGSGGHAPTRPTADEALARISVLEAENADLRRRVRELETARASAPNNTAVPSGNVDSLRRLLTTVIERSPSIVFVKDIEGRYVLVNQCFLDACGVTRDEICGKTDTVHLPPEAAEALRAQDQAIIDSGVPVQYEENVPLRGEESTYYTIKFPLFDEQNNLIGLCGIATDITATKRVQRERDAMREQMLAAHKEALRELSTPLVPIADGVLAMPLVGRIDEARASLIMTTLLEGITRESAHTAILDITGVRSVDAQVADALVNAARAARLLGARVLLSGLRADVAKTLVDIGCDLGSITAVPTLQSAIARALSPEREVGAFRARSHRPDRAGSHPRR
jgi:rsbT co-antagonist protein RsbR